MVNTYYELHEKSVFFDFVSLSLVLLFKNEPFDAKMSFINLFPNNSDKFIIFIYSTHLSSESLSKYLLT